MLFRSLDVLARHAWRGHEPRLDLFADRERSADREPEPRAAVARQIHAVLEDELLRRYRLAEKALALLDDDGRPPNPELGGLLALAGESQGGYYLVPRVID